MLNIQLEFYIGFPFEVMTLSVSCSEKLIITHEEGKHLGYQHVGQKNLDYLATLSLSCEDRISQSF